MICVQLWCVNIGTYNEFEVRWQNKCMYLGYMNFKDRFCFLYNIKYNNIVYTNITTHII